MKFTPSWVTASDGSLVVYIQTLCSLAFVLGGLRSFLQAFMAKAEHALALELSARARARKKVVWQAWLDLQFFSLVILLKKNGVKEVF